jgi:hypothetical protein
MDSWWPSPELSMYLGNSSGLALNARSAVGPGVGVLTQPLGGLITLGRSEEWSPPVGRRVSVDRLV